MQLEVKKVYLYDGGEVEVELVHNETGITWHLDISEEDLTKIKPHLPGSVIEQIGDLGGDLRG